MRILMLTRFRYSRVMGHLFSLAAELNRQGIKTVVVTVDCPARYLEPLRHYQQFFPCLAENRPGEILRLARSYRIDLLHLHDLSLISMAQKLLHALRIPCGLTLHEELPPAANLSMLPGLSFLITSSPAASRLPAALRQKLYFIPEGIELEAYQPGPKEGFRITFIGEEGGFTSEGALEMLKAAGLADLELELVCPEPLPLLKGHFHGWLLDCATVLKGSQVVIGQNRGLLEGMACGNAALILGRSYRGIFNPAPEPAAALFPDLSGKGNDPPCYRSIFYDLSALLKDRARLESLQQQSRKFVRENCDLRLIAEQTHRLYRQAAWR